MKYLFFMVVLLVSMAAKAEQVKVEVSGMVCSLCAQGIEKKFSKQEEVKDLKVDMDKKVIFLNTHNGKSISDQKITQIITEAGYNVAKIQRQ